MIVRDSVEIVADPGRFCYHLAADMPFEGAAKWLAQVKERAVMKAREALDRLLSQEVSVCALIAREGVIGDLRQVLTSHSRIHAAEGIFYRDVFLEACSIPTRVISPKSLDPAKVGICAPAPLGRDRS